MRTVSTVKTRDYTFALGNIFETFSFCACAGAAKSGGIGCAIREKAETGGERADQAAEMEAVDRRPEIPCRVVVAPRSPRETAEAS